MQISFGSQPSSKEVIATKFCTWHDSYAVVACAKCCCDMITTNWITAKWILHWIWIVIKKNRKWNASFSKQFFVFWFKCHRRTNRKPAIIGSSNMAWTNDDKVYRCIHVSPGLNELIHWYRERRLQYTDTITRFWLQVIRCHYRHLTHWGLT